MPIQQGMQLACMPSKYNLMPNFDVKLQSCANLMPNCNTLGFITHFHYLDANTTGHTVHAHTQVAKGGWPVAAYVSFSATLAMVLEQAGLLSMQTQLLHHL